jgi:hypothetical protein
MGIEFLFKTFFDVEYFTKCNGEILMLRIQLFISSVLILHGYLLQMYNEVKAAIKACEI